MSEGDRLRVDALVRAGSDLKLQYGNTLAVRAKLEEALRLAEGVGSPWIEVVAYRLGHLLMRSSPTQEDDLREAGRLFQMASNSPTYGALARAYRLAAMHRAGASMTSMMAVLEEAVEQVKDRSDVDDELESPILQHQTLNLLELAGYIIGLPTTSLDGLGGTAPSQNGWILVGPDARTARVQCDQAFALEELDVRAKQEPDAILYVLHEERSRDRWRLRGKRVWSRPSPRSLDILALLHSRRARDWEHIDQLLGVETDTLRQTKKRLCTALKIETDDLFTSPSSGGLRLEPGPGVRAYGAVSLFRLSRLTDGP